MATASKTRGARHGGGADPNVIELGKLMLARAPALGKAMADLLCREIDAYRDGSVVSKDQVAEIDLGQWKVSRVIDAGKDADGMAWAK